MCSSLIVSELEENDFELLKYTVLGAFQTVDQSKIMNLQPYLSNLINSNPALKVGNLYYNIEFLDGGEDGLTVILTTEDSIDIMCKPVLNQSLQLIH